MKEPGTRVLFVLSFLELLDYYLLKFKKARYPNKSEAVKFMT